MVLHLGVEKWRWASESAEQVSLPVTCQAASVTQACHGIRQVILPVTCQAASVMQPDRLTCSCDHVGVITVERFEKKGVLPLLVSAPSSCRIGDSNSCPPDLELGALTKWLASRC
jgi:hypothetical protein